MATSRRSGKEPEEKDKLIRLERGLEISSFSRRRILIGMLLGPEALFLWREEIKIEMSLGTVGDKKIEKGFGSFKNL